MPIILFLFFRRKENEKNVSLLFITVMLISCISLMSACGSSIDVQENSNSNQSTINNDQPNNVTNNPDLDNVQIIDWLTGQNIYGMHAINFSNGMALVPSINGESKNLHAIDKNGNLLFTLDNYETAHDDNSFTNGLIYIYNL